MSAKFIPPKIQDNPNGWGPCAVPEQFKDMPYQPFYKADRLGKVSPVREKTQIAAVLSCHVCCKLKLCRITIVLGHTKYCT